LPPRGSAESLQPLRAGGGARPPDDDSARNRAVSALPARRGGDSERSGDTATTAFPPRPPYRRAGRPRRPLTCSRPR